MGWAEVVVLREETETAERSSSNAETLTERKRRWLSTLWLSAAWAVENH